MSYYETEDGLYMTEGGGACPGMVSEPVEFQIRLPDEWMQKERLFVEESAPVQYYIVRMHRDPQTDEVEYTLLDCEKEGALLHFMTDRFSTFAVIRGIMTVPEAVPEKKPEETPVSGENMTALAPERTEKEKTPSMTHIHAPDTGDNTPDICGFFPLFLAGMFIIGWICAICWSQNKKLPFDMLIFMVE